MGMDDADDSSPRPAEGTLAIGGLVFLSLQHIHEGY
jgi:hypothetical protein